MTYCLCGNGGSPWKCVKYAPLFTLILGLVTRIITPRTVVVNGEEYYLNINMVYEYWDEVRGGAFDLLHIVDDSHPVVFTVFLNISGWLINVVPHIVMCFITRTAHHLVYSSPKKGVTL